MKFKYEPNSLTRLKTQLTFVVGFFQTVNAIFTDWRIGVVLISLPVDTWRGGFFSGRLHLSCFCFEHRLCFCQYERTSHSFVAKQTVVLRNPVQACVERLVAEASAKVEKKLIAGPKLKSRCALLYIEWLAFFSSSQCCRNVYSQKKNIHPKLLWIWRIYFRKYHGWKWLCVLPLLHVQSSTFDKNYLQGS